LRGKVTEQTQQKKETERERERENKLSALLGIQVSGPILLENSYKGRTN
jgi:hypothetical protein